MHFVLSYDEKSIFSSSATPSLYYVQDYLVWTQSSIKSNESEEKICVIENYFVNIRCRNSFPDLMFLESSITFTSSFNHGIMLEHTAYWFNVEGSIIFSDCYLTK